MPRGADASRKFAAVGLAAALLQVLLDHVVEEVIGLIRGISGQKLIVADLSGNMMASFNLTQIDLFKPIFTRMSTHPCKNKIPICLKCFEIIVKEPDVDKVPKLIQRTFCMRQVILLINLQ